MLRGRGRYRVQVKQLCIKCETEQKLRCRVFNRAHCGFLHNPPDIYTPLFGTMCCRHMHARAPPGMQGSLCA